MGGTTETGRIPCDCECGTPWKLKRCAAAAGARGEHRGEEPGALRGACECGSTAIRRCTGRASRATRRWCGCCWIAGRTPRRRRMCVVGRELVRQHGWKVLHTASFHGREAVVRLLLERGAKPNATRDVSSRRGCAELGRTASSLSILCASQLGPTSPRSLLSRRCCVTVRSTAA